MNIKEMSLGTVIVAIVIFIILPLPTPLLDFLLMLNISLSLLILLGTLYSSEPLDMSLFPTILLVATLFRLSLSVSTTRLILGSGYDGGPAGGPGGRGSTGPWFPFLIAGTAPPLVRVLGAGP